MQSLDEKEWKPIPLSDLYMNGHGKRLTKENRISGNKPLLTAGESNNGVAEFISNKDMPEHSDFISVDMFGNAFFHPYKATGDDNIYFFENKDLSDDIKIFTCVNIEKQACKFSYGKQFRQPNADGLKIMLPVTDSGEPDCAYMAEYARQKRDTMLAKYRTYVEAHIVELGEVAEIPALDEKEWKPIFISSMFELVRGSENNMAMLEDGDTPLISAKANNNGLKGFVHNPKKIIFGQCITLNNDGDGGAGLAYYQPANMALDSHVTALVPLFDMSAFAMLFIAKCISGLHGFFGHGLSISNPRAKRLRIMLPVTDSGEPDYEYMEQYSKNMMLRKYQQYLTFLQQRSNIQ